MTLKQGQSHKPWHKLVDPKQGYNNAMFEKNCLQSVHEKANDKVFVNQETHQLSPLKMCKSTK